MSFEGSHSAVYFCMRSDRADVLTQMPASSSNEFLPATSTFTPQIDHAEVAGQALHSCAAALSEVPNDMQFLSDKKFQINRCVIEAVVLRLLNGSARLSLTVFLKSEPRWASSGRPHERILAGMSWTPRCRRLALSIGSPTDSRLLPRLAESTAMPSRHAENSK